jgi:hypothetical protein
MNDSVNIFFTSEIFSDSVPTMKLTQVRWTGGAGSLLLAENIVQKSQLLHSIKQVQECNIGTTLPRLFVE